MQATDAQVNRIASQLMRKYHALRRQENARFDAVHAQLGLEKCAHEAQFGGMGDATSLQFSDRESAEHRQHEGALDAISEQESCDFSAYRARFGRNS